MIGEGIDTMKSIQLLVVIIISFSHISLSNAAGPLSKKYIPSVGISLYFPKDYTLEKSNEPNRRGSFISYNFSFNFDLNCIRCNYPFLQEIQFFSIKSIKEYEKECSETNRDRGSGEGFCETGDYPTIKEYKKQKLALQNPERFKAKYQIKKIGTRNYIVSISSGTDCIFREYRCFSKDTMVAIWIVMRDPSQVEKADKILSQLMIE